MSFTVRFWGVRGSIACPTPRHMRYGGNTSCVELEVEGHKIILDAGTGIRELGLKYRQEQIKEAFLLFSHSHWDHVCGFPFFKPAFDPEFKLKVYAGHLGERSIYSVLCCQMMTPLFPIPLDTMRAQISFTEFVAGESFELVPGLKIRTCRLNHPDQATAYRFDYKGKSFCYVTDTEHVPGKLDEDVLKLIEGADVVVYDASYTDETFPCYVTWGHSTWQEAVRLAKAAHVKTMMLFHHEPNHTDDIMDRISQAAREAYPGAIAAREGMMLDLLAPGAVHEQIAYPDLERAGVC